MRGTTIAAIALLISAQALASDKDHGQPVTPTPETTRSGQGFSHNGYKEHFAVSALVGLAVSNHVETESAARAWAYAMVPGLLKEILDSQQRGNHFSSRDMIANALGAAVGVGAGRVLLVSSRDGRTTVALLVRN